MAHVTNFVPKLPIFSNLCRMMSCPILSPSLGTEPNPFLDGFIEACHFLRILPHGFGPPWNPTGCRHLAPGTKYRRSWTQPLTRSQTPPQPI